MRRGRVLIRDFEAIDLVTCVLESILKDEGRGVTRNPSESNQDFCEKLILAGAACINLMSVKKKKTIQLVLLATGFTVSEFDPDGYWGTLSCDAYVAYWLGFRELAGIPSFHQHSEASAAGCEHPECLVRHSSIPRTMTTVPESPVPNETIEYYNG